jgi:uncharacterized protein (TIGR02466 family)
MTAVISTFCSGIYSNNVNLSNDLRELVRNLDYRRVDFDNGYISNDLKLFERPDFESLKFYLLEQIHVYTQQILKISTEYNFYITTSWANKHNTSDFSQEHDHANSLISGIVCVDVDKDSGNIIFYNPQQNMGLSLQFDFAEYNEFNSNKLEINPIVGDLFLFPSSLKHSVSKNLSNIDRYTLAFNVFAHGKFGSHERGLTI